MNNSHGFTEVQINRMIASRIRKGYNEKESREMLKEIMTRHDGCNLAFSLHYNGYITLRAAEKMSL